MKRLKLILLVMTILVSLSSCGDEEKLSPNNGYVEKETGGIETSEVLKVENETQKTGVENADLLPQLIEEFDRAAVIEETVLFNERDVEIIAKELSFSNQKVNVNITIANNTSTNLEFSCGSAACDVNSVNNMMATGGFMNCEVASGEVLDETISFEISDLVLFGMSNVTEIEIGFWVSGDDYDNFYTGPLKIKTSLGGDTVNPENSYQDFLTGMDYKAISGNELLYFSDDVLFESADGMIRVISVAVVKNEEGNVTALFEIENQSSEKIQAWGKETHINGALMKSYSSFVELINSGKRLLVNFPLSLYAQEYQGDADVAMLGDFEFTLCIGENSNIAKESAKVRISMENEGIVLKSE